MYLVLQKDVEAELRDNNAEQKRLLGSSLVYGESIQVSPLSPLSFLSPLSPLHFFPSPLPPLTLQLRHTLTGKYVTVNATLTSRTENTSLRVELCEENSSGCIFKILPHYKVRSVGDVVSYSFIKCTCTCIYM